MWISARAMGTQKAMNTVQSETSWELVEKEDTVGTDARAAEEEPTRGMRSQGSRRKWSLGEGFAVRKEWSCQTIWGGCQTHALDLERRKSVGNEAGTDVVEGWEWTPDSRGITSEHRAASIDNPFKKSGCEKKKRDMAAARW